MVGLLPTKLLDPCAFSKYLVNITLWFSSASSPDFGAFALPPLLLPCFAAESLS